jgi:acetolactate synthase-1/2/3 large subunit
VRNTQLVQPLPELPLRALAAPERPNAAHAALSQVAGRVHRRVPCVAGGNNMPLIEAAYAVGLTPVHPRSEVAAGFMANGIAWESRLPTLCLVITSVGVYGLVQALYAAKVNRRPVVLLSGEVSGIGRGAVQAGDGWDGPLVTEVTRPFTAWSVDAQSPELAIRAVLRAVQIAAAERAPVHVNIPLRIQKSGAP